MQQVLTDWIFTFLGQRLQWINMKLIDCAKNKEINYKLNRNCRGFQCIVTRKLYSSQLLTNVIGGIGDYRISMKSLL